MRQWIERGREAVRRRQRRGDSKPCTGRSAGNKTPASNAGTPGSGASVRPSAGALCMDARQYGWYALAPPLPPALLLALLPPALLPALSPAANSACAASNSRMAACRLSLWPSSLPSHMRWKRSGTSHSRMPRDCSETKPPCFGQQQGREERLISKQSACTAEQCIQQQAAAQPSCAGPLTSSCPASSPASSAASCGSAGTSSATAAAAAAVAGATAAAAAASAATGIS